MGYKYFFAFLVLMSANVCSAQESMMPDVSYPFLEKLVAAAKANYPRMKTYDHAIRVSELTVQKAKLDWLNLVSFIYLINPAASSSSAAAAGAGGFQTGVSVSIGSILQKPGEVKAARENLKVTKLGQEEYFLTIQAQVQQRYFQYVQALTLLNWSNKDAQNMESTLKDIKYKFEKGELPYSAYNSALTAFSSSTQVKIHAEGNLLIAKSALEEIIGAKLETIK